MREARPQAQVEIGDARSARSSAPMPGRAHSGSSGSTTTQLTSADRVLYSGPVVTATPMHTGFSGVVRDGVAAAARLGAPRAARRCRVDDAPGRRPDAREEARAARARDGRRPAPPRGRGATSRPPTRCAISQLWGDEEVAIAGVVETVRLRRPRRRLSIVTARSSDDDTAVDHRQLVQPAVARRQAPAGHAACGCAGGSSRHGFEVKRYDLGEARATADHAPVYRGERAGALDAAARARARRRSRRTHTTCSTRCRPSSSCRSGATRSRRSTSRSTPARPRRRGGGSRSTSWSRSSSRSPRSRDERRRRAARRRRASSSRATARCCRSTLTEHQEHAIAEIDRDLARTRRCSGCSRATSARARRSVALYALLRAVEAGRQGALMAPTETLAEQHFLTVEALCAELGVRVRAAHRQRRREGRAATSSSRRGADRGRARTR